MFAWLDDEGYLAGLGCSAVASLYADDLVLFLVPNALDMEVLKTTLSIFASASSLFTNLEKCVATPIYCSDQDRQQIMDTHACTIEDFPCRYLGIPLSVFELRRSDGQFLIASVAKRIPCWKGILLNLAGRTALAKSTFSAIPIHLSIAVCLSLWAIEAIVRRQRAFIWTGRARSLPLLVVAEWPGGSLADLGRWVDLI